MRGTDEPGTRLSRRLDTRDAVVIGGSVLLIGGAAVLALREQARRRKPSDS